MNASSSIIDARAAESLQFLAFLEESELESLENQPPPTPLFITKIIKVVTYNLKKKNTLHKAELPSRSRGVAQIFGSFKGVGVGAGVAYFI